LSQELQEETQHYEDDDGMKFDYAPTVHQSDCDSLINDEVDEITSEGWLWECEYYGTFKLYKD